MQTRALDSDGAEAMQKHRGWPTNPFDGIAEIWFENEESVFDMTSNPEALEAGKQVAEDELNFNGPTQMWIGRERIIFNR